jgi:hypothetical protein
MGYLIPTAFLDLPPGWENVLDIGGNTIYFK